MGKRSTGFERRDRDFYPTPRAAVAPLLPHLGGKFFVEPCAGDGALINHLEAAGQLCVSATDIEPRGGGIVAAEVLSTPYWGWCNYFITNPPWDRKILHPLIEHLSDIFPTWLLFDADWIHTKQAIPYIPRLQKIVSIGRVKWIPDSKMTGKDNCCWYLFDKDNTAPPTFYGRTQ